MNAKKILVYCLAALLGGCLPVMSLHPLYTDNDTISDPNLIGTWTDSESTWQFSQPDKDRKMYNLLFSGDEDVVGSFDAHLVQLNDKLFLDLFPDSLPYDDDEDLFKLDLPYNMFFVVPVHTFIRVDSIDPNLTLQLTFADETKKLLKEDPNAVRFEEIEGHGHDILLTASTEELQLFVSKYSEDSRLFANELILNRVVSPDPNTTDPNIPDPNAPDIAVKDPNTKE